MPLSDDALIVLLAKRHDLYRQLRLVDGRVAEAQNSPFFSTRPGNSVTMGGSIEGLEGEIADINRQLERVRGPTGASARPAADLA